MYEPFIYQLFNIVFTGLPIVLYGLFDYEVEKKTFLATGNHTLYAIGLTNALFTLRVFQMWVLAGCAQALFVFLTAFLANQAAPCDSSGRMYDFWPGGQNVYMVCIFMASFTILLMHHRYDYLCCTFIGLCSFVYFPIVWIESTMSMFP
jgi:magnesium-transporting ATPase (P-type)